MPVQKLECPQCHQECDGLDRCDFCGNSYCELCQPLLSADLAQLCSGCVKLREKLRGSESARTHRLRLLLRPVPAPVRNGKVTRCFKLRAVTTKLVNLARQDMATPGLDKRTDRLWRKTVKILRSFK